MADVPGRRCSALRGVLDLHKPQADQQGRAPATTRASSELVVNPEFYPAMEVTTSLRPGGVTKRSFRFAEDPGRKRSTGCSHQRSPATQFQSRSSKHTRPTGVPRPKPFAPSGAWSVVMSNQSTLTLGFGSGFTGIRFSPSPPPNSRRAESPESTPVRGGSNSSIYFPAATGNSNAPLSCRFAHS